MAELVFEVTQEADGGYCAECLTLDIFTQADTWDELRANVREAVRAYFFDGGILHTIESLCRLTGLSVSGPSMQSSERSPVTRV